MNLVLGFVTEYGFDWSVQMFEDRTPTEIAETLQNKIKGNNCCGAGDNGLWPDRILVIENGDSDATHCPRVSARYHAGIDYPRESQGHFVDWKKNHVTAKGL
ncbi:hypothetical protein LCGC14_1125390 [marine sediment metagenome]|uniref:Uncharacterized protein n=1 Tax=marine sediment metagenome TaxID=412755 RepID=A0A0F9M7H3_9ZZZZ